jgi:phage shock protein A
VKRQLNDHNIDDAMQRFENYERKMDDLEGQIEAYDMGQRTLADEIAELETDNTIDADLAELKARLQGESAAAPADAPANDQSANG